jgi:hypothetical protein
VHGIRGKLKLRHQYAMNDILTGREARCLLLHTTGEVRDGDRQWTNRADLGHLSDASVDAVALRMALEALLGG